MLVVVSDCIILKKAPKTAQRERERDGSGKSSEKMTSNNWCCSLMHQSFPRLSSAHEDDTDRDQNIPHSLACTCTFAKSNEQNNQLYQSRENDLPITTISTTVTTIPTTTISTTHHHPPAVAIITIPNIIPVGIGA